MPDNYREREREIERRVLLLTDRLLEAAMALGLLEGDAKAAHYRSAVETVKELCGLLSEVLNGQEQHMEALLRQVCAQKLPSARVMDSFGTFTADLEAIAKDGLSFYQQSKAPAESGPLEETQPDAQEQTSAQEQMSAVGLCPEVEAGMEVETPDTIEPSLEETIPPMLEEASGEEKPVPDDCFLRSCLRLSANEQVVIGYFFHGIRVDYYLPRLGLMVVIEDEQRRNQALRLEYLCRIKGLDWMMVPETEMQDVRALSRRLKRVL